MSWWELEMRERNAATQNGCDNPLGLLIGLAFDGRFLAAVNGEQPVLLVWDSDTALPPREPLLDANGRVNWDVSSHEGTLLDLPFIPQCVAFAPSRSWLAAGGAEIALVNPLTLERTEHPRAGGEITALAFSADRRELLAGTEDETVEVWDADAGHMLREFDWKHGAITAVAVAPDATTFAAGTEAGQVIVWDREG